MKKLLLLFSVALFATAVSAQTTLYVRGADPGWGAQSDNTWANTSVSGSTYVWDWSAAPKTITGEFKLAAIAADGGWDDTANYGPASATKINFSNGTFTSTVVCGAGAQNFNVPSQGATLSVSRIELDTNTLSVTIKGSDGASIDPTTIAMYFRGADNEWLNGIEESEVPAEWKGDNSANPNIYVWDWSNSPKQITGEFKFADWDYKTHNYGSGEADQSVYVGTAKTIAVGGENLMPGNVTLDNVTKVTLNLQTMTVLFSDEIPQSVDETSAAVVTAANGTIYADGELVIYDLVGNNVTAENGNLKGVYVVVVDGVSSKINVQ